MNEGYRKVLGPTKKWIIFFFIEYIKKKLKTWEMARFVELPDVEFIYGSSRWLLPFQSDQENFSLLLFLFLLISFLCYCRRFFNFLETKKETRNKNKINIK